MWLSAGTHEHVSRKPFFLRGTLFCLVLSERGVVWEETIILLPDNVHYVFLSATIPNARQFAEWICHLHKQVGHPLAPSYTCPCLQRITHKLLFFLGTKLILSLVSLWLFLAVPCCLHGLPSHTAATLHLSSRGRWTPPGCRWKCEVKHSLHLIEKLVLLTMNAIMKCENMSLPSGRFQGGQF